MTNSEFSIVWKRVKRWTVFVYTLVALSLMMIIAGCGYVWFLQLEQLTEVFRDQAKPVGDDGMYGATVALLMFVLFLAPSALLPLILVVIVDRVLGTACPECKASLTLGNRGETVLRSGTCAKCSADLRIYLAIADGPPAAGL